MVQRCHISLPRETWIYLTILAVVVVGAILREINLLIILAGLMFGPLWISWHLIRTTLKKLSISRKLPRVAFPGELIMVELTVKNGRRAIDSWALVVQDRIRHAHFKQRASTKTARLLIPHVKAGRERTASYRCRLWQRGPYRLGPVRVSTKVPVGLLRGDVTVRTADELLVYPQLGRLKSKWSDLVKMDRLGQRTWHRNQGPIEGDFYGLRDWRSGDSRRWIHWRSSAKRNNLVVRQFEQYRAHDFVVLLDLWPAQPEGQTEESRDKIELAVSFVATVVASHCRHANGHMVLGVAGEKVQVVKGTANVALLNEALEVLAEARTSKQDGLAELVSQLPPTLSTDDQFVIVTTHESARLEPARYGSNHRHPQLRDMLAQAVCISVNDASFDELFELDEIEAIATVGKS